MSEALATGEFEVIRARGDLRLARVVPGVATEGALRRNLSIVVDLCEQRGVDYFVIPGPAGERLRVGIPGPCWGSFVDALSAEAATRPLYAGVGARAASGDVRRWTVLLSRAEAVRAARTQAVVEVFEIVRPRPGSRSFDRPQACVVERWDPDEFDGLRTTRPNQWTTHVRGKARSAVRAEIAGREVKSLAAFQGTSMFEPDFPVDAVYLWVDGADQAWQERKNAALRSHGMAAPLPGAADERFRDNGELRYSLRSIDRFAPWIRTIYLVTDQQVPSWLDPDHPRIEVVDHRDIFGSVGTLPTFNSHAIGARLHHIGGLSEHYLCFNDDVFLGRPVSPAKFFLSNGVAKFFLSRTTLPMVYDEAATPQTTLHEQARSNSVVLIQNDFGRRPTRTFFHTPLPQRRSVLTELERRYPAAFKTTWDSQFRSGTDYEVNCWLHHYYGYLTGATIPGAIRYDYFDLAASAARRRMKRTRARRDLDAFCINDSAAVTSEQQADAAKWLDGYFPEPASWER